MNRKMKNLMGKDAQVMLLSQFFTDNSVIEIKVFDTVFKKDIDGNIEILFPDSSKQTIKSEEDAVMLNFYKNNSQKMNLCSINNWYSITHTKTIYSYKGCINGYCLEFSYDTKLPREYKIVSLSLNSNSSAYCLLDGESSKLCYYVYFNHLSKATRIYIDEITNEIVIGHLNSILLDDFIDNCGNNNIILKARS